MNGGESWLPVPAPWRAVDESAAAPDLDPAWHFAADLAVARLAGEGASPPTLRLWRHPGALIVGPAEARLPHLAAAAADAGLPVLIRPSGGALVPLDAGVLNCSLLFPTGGSSIADGYRAMQRLVEEALAPFGGTVEAGEVSGSFCPGAWDLSLGGRKFAGIAQRRTRQGAAVQAFLLVEGAAAGRARRAAAFYAAAGGRRQVDEASVASLAESLAEPVTVRTAAQALIGALARLTGDVEISPLTEAEQRLADDLLEEIAARQPAGLR